MDNIDFLYIRVKTEELLERLGESETIAVHSDGFAAGRSEALKVQRAGLWSRLRRAVRMRRRSIRVRPDPAPESGSTS